MNAHIGSVRDEYEDVMGPYGFGDKNPEGDIVLSLFKNHEMRVLNTFFKKDREKKITYKSGGAETEIDLIAMRSSSAIKVKDCKAYPGEACLTQHRPVCAVLEVKCYKDKHRKGHKKIRAWRLKDEEVRSRYQAALHSTLAESNGTWADLSGKVKKVSEEICGVTSGKRGREREAWWWNEDVQRCIKEKKIAFKQWQRSGTTTDKHFYNNANKRAKRAVAASKQASWAELADSLRRRDGQEKMYKLPKQSTTPRCNMITMKTVNSAGKHSALKILFF